ncbi:Aste57867_23408 [Aphanomyces stellatus]|uniref:Aste57867_23408 protein n=1 Tax=Aphanomyces stellatus TaxID=120398 RepID=A0A485LMS5_9STRA|nr:hypothetical protein As57867_023337 [Aphanomyces stellatus]VFU00054.1 Aste57867_23408 [Aphanomyces stellatus]
MYRNHDPPGNPGKNDPFNVDVQAHATLSSIISVVPADALAHSLRAPSRWTSYRRSCALGSTRPRTTVYTTVVLPTSLPRAGFEDTASQRGVDVHQQIRPSSRHVPSRSTGPVTRTRHHRNPACRRVAHHCPMLGNTTWHWRVWVVDIRVNRPIIDHLRRRAQPMVIKEIGTQSLVTTNATVELKSATKASSMAGSRRSYTFNCKGLNATEQEILDDTPEVQ